MRPPADFQWRTSELAARHLWEVFKLHYTVLSTEEILSNRWVAVRLSDGVSDNTAYESMSDAIRCNGFSDSCMYYRIPPPPGPSVHECDRILWYARGVHEAGYRPGAAHEAAELIVPVRNELLVPTSGFTLSDPRHRP